MRLSPRGRVLTCTVVHIAPDDFAMEAPYAVAVVETPEGARLMAQVADTDPSEVKPGMEITLEFRRIRAEHRGGILCYGHKAVPVD
jgi:uncharacterized OB-fold protein